MVKEINPHGSSDISQMLIMNNLLYFYANDGVDGLELWQSDGTAAGTVLVQAVTPNGNSEISAMLAMNNILYSYINDGTDGLKLWRSDGTAAGTVLLKNVRADTRLIQIRNTADEADWQSTLLYGQ